LKGFLEGSRHLGRFHHGNRPFCNRPGNGLNIHCLEVFLVQLGPWRLTGDAQNRDGIGAGGIQPGDHVGAGGTRSTDTYPDIPRFCPGITLGHVRSPFNMACQDVIDTPYLAHGSVKRIDCGTRQPKGNVDTFFLQNMNGGFRSCHFSHYNFSSTIEYNLCIHFRFVLVFKNRRLLHECQFFMENISIKNLTPIYLLNKQVLIKI
jgi:hypothetical protein